MTTLHPIPTLHDLACEVAHYDKADPGLGIEQDHYVFTLDELNKLVEKLKK